MFFTIIVTCKGGLWKSSYTTLYMIFSITYYLELRDAIPFFIDVKFLPSNVIILFYNAQTNKLTIVGKI